GGADQPPSYFMDRSITSHRYHGTNLLLLGSHLSQFRGVTGIFSINHFKRSFFFIQTFFKRPPNLPPVPVSRPLVHYKNYHTDTALYFITVLYVQESFSFEPEDTGMLSIPSPSSIARWMASSSSADNG